MPEVSRCLGIVIRFYYNDQLPPPFHAEYGEHQGQIAIGSHALLRGSLPGRVLGLVQEWAALDGGELEQCWEQAGRGEIPNKVAPLV